MTSACFLRRGMAILAIGVTAWGCDGAAITETDAATDPPDAGAMPIDAARPPPFVHPTGMTAGCGTPTSEQGVVDRTLTVRGVERRYRLVLPDNYDPSVPHALVFAFHGLGDSAENFQSALRFEQLAGGEAILVYPHGVHPTLGANGWDLSVEGADVELFDTIRAQLEGELCVDRARELALGFSYGAFMTSSLGCHRGDVIRAIGPMSGGPPRGGRCAGQVAAFIVHGAADDLVDYDLLGIRTREYWRGRDGCDETGPMDANGCVSFEGCDDGYPVVFCTHPGAHTVPSWAPDAIWSFFESLDE
ncbi:alpha/beta hydrolase family esterase [Sandaracinus amylolyticus]|uniref:alpha/beta hydrolase family esterase n=1 Tax=Sandaracinus amylolyticus TaxID=927083 RepID=UPI001F3BEBE0|nr:hypothetical protein [Sandaracinus amylolyticus]UJR85697.1 Hypothetical protein I5071_77770 [Sandaracinus amylolyticus]